MASPLEVLISGRRIEHEPPRLLSREDADVIADFLAGDDVAYCILYRIPATVPPGSIQALLQPVYCDEPPIC